MKSDQAYLDLIDSNLDLRIKLAQETVETIKNKRKIHKLIKDLERCELYIKYLEKYLVPKEDEIKQLKIKCQSIQYELDKCHYHLDLKEEALVAQDERIIQLEDTIDKLKNQIIEISIFKNYKETDQQSMTTIALNQIANIATALDRIERFIGGDHSSNPINNLNLARTTLGNLRAQFLALGHQIDMDANTIVNLQNLLNNTTREVNNHLQHIANLRNSILQREQMLIQNWRVEVNRRLEWYQFARELQTNGQRIAFRKQNRINTLTQEKIALRIIIRCKDNQIAAYRRHANVEYSRRRYLACVREAQRWRAQCRILDQNLNNLNQQIFTLQNNPPGNMAEARREPIFSTIAPIFAKHEQYTGQESPDDYLDRIWNSISHLEPNMTALETANAGDFNNAIKCSLLKSKLGGKYIPVPQQNNFVNPAVNIDSPDTLRAWLRTKYQRETIGTQQTAIQRLSQERFLVTDSPDTYEKRIRPLLLGVPDNDPIALSFLKNHLSGDLYTWMKITNPATTDAYFTELKNLWLERNPIVSSQAPVQQIIQNSLPNQPQIDSAYNASSKANDFIIRLAKDLQYSGLKSDHETLEKYIYDELQNRLGGSRIAAHNRKSPFDSINTNASRRIVKKKSSKVTNIRRCSICGNKNHTKVNCPKKKKSKNINYIYQSEEENEETTEEDDDEEVEYVEYDDDDDEDDEPQNCYAVKKNWIEEEYL